MDILKIIENISTVILYIAPGMIFFSIFEFITNKKCKDNTYFIWSIVLSFGIVSIMKLICHATDTIIITGFTIIVSIILPILVGYLVIHSAFQRFLVWSGINKTIHHSIWDDIIDDYDVFLKIYIPVDKVYYYGLYKGHENKFENVYIILTDYEIRDYSSTLLRDYSSDRTRWVTINSKDISRVEIVYSEKSNKSQKSTFTPH